MKDKIELDFKRWFRNHYPDWSEAYEPRHGGGVGIPDIQILWKPDDMKLATLIPIECKIGSIEIIKSGKVLKVKKVRASQVSWHYRFWRAGGVSKILVGVWDCYDVFWRIYELPSIELWWDRPSRSFPLYQLTEWHLGKGGKDDD